VQVNTISCLEEAMPEATQETQSTEAQTAALYKQLEKKLDKYFTSMDEFKDVVGGVKKSLGQIGGDTDVAALLKGMDEKIKTANETAEQVKKQLDRARYGSTSRRRDAIVEAMPEELKSWIPRVAGITGGEVMLPTVEEGVVRVQRGRSQVALANMDPVLYTALGGWFQQRVKGYLEAQKGNSEKAQKHATAADKLRAALDEGMYGMFPPDQRAALAEGTGAEGGFLVPLITEPVIGELMKEFSVVRAAGPTVIQMQSDQHDLPDLASDFTVTIDNEAQTIADSEGTFGNNQLIARRFGAMVTISIELIQDNIVNLMDFVMAHLIRVLGRTQDGLALEGDGVAPNWLGVFGTTGVANVNNAGAASDAGVALALASWLKMRYAGEHWTTVRAGAIWCHPWVVRDLVQAVISAGTVAAQVIFDVTGDAPERSGRQRLYPTSKIRRNRGATQTNETTAFHGDPTFMVFGERMGTEFSINPYAEGPFKKGQILLRMLQRTGFVCWVPEYFSKLSNIEVVA
jgi:HK97 family phage major capsid protein